jgi:chromosome segregation ATPase
VLKEKEIMIDSIRRQLSQTKEDLHLKEQELDAYMRRAVSEDKDKSLIERKEKTRIHKELDTLEKNYMELTHQRKADLTIKQNEIENLNKVLAQLEEQKTVLSKKADALEGENRDFKKKLILKGDQFEMLEKEFAKLQDKLRDVQNHEFNLSTAKEHQDATLKIQEDQITKITNRYQEDEHQWREDKNSFQQKV